MLAMLGDIETRLQAAGQTLTGGLKHGLIAKAVAGGEGGLVRLDRRELEQLQFARTRGRAAGEISDRAATFRGRRRQRGAGKGAATEQGSERAGAGGFAAGRAVRGGHRQDRPGPLGADRPDESSPMCRSNITTSIGRLARMLPDNLTLGRLFVPFDLISRTIMVACCNPFDAAGREAVQQSLDYTVTWYLARPAAIIRTLQDIYRLEAAA